MDAALWVWRALRLREYLIVNTAVWSLTAGVLMADADLRHTRWPDIVIAVLAVLWGFLGPVLAERESKRREG